MGRAAIGFRAHTGWAATVAIAGPPAAPTVIDRRRLDLLGPGVPWEVYHAARRLEIDEAEQLVRGAIEATEAMAVRALRAIIDELRTAGHRVVASGVVLASGRPPLTLEEALASHAGLHAAEGQLYRGALIHASDECGLPVLGVPERDLYGRATADLGMPIHQVRGRVSELGRELGPPWAQDQKSAALIAWLALTGKSRARGR